MGLLKLKPDHKLNQWAQKEALKLARQIYSLTLAKEIYLFGSVISGDFTRDSDLDLLLVFKSREDLQQAKKIVYGKPLSTIAVDYILKTEEEFQKRREIGGVCFEAYHNGKLL